MHYWLVKTEPSEWSWGDQVREKTTYWDGVRNYQAANYLKEMRVGDLCFFYHSVRERRIVGIVRVIQPAEPDPTDPTARFVRVKMEYVCPVPQPVGLDVIKQHPDLQELPLVRQSRLSVMPIPEVDWQCICALGHVIIPQEPV